MIKSIDFNKYINIVFILFAFCIPISRAGIVFLSVLLIVLWIFEGDFQRKVKEIKESTILKLIILFVGYYVISLLWSSNLIEGLHYIKKFWYFIPLYIMYTSLQKRYISYMVSAFLLAMLISEVISYGIFFELWSFKDVPHNDPTPFMNHLQYSMFLAFAALLLLNKVFTEKLKIYKYGYFIYFLTVCVNLFMNGGRTGQVAFTISIFIVVFLNIKNKIKAFVTIFVLLSVILSVSYNISPLFNQRVNLMFNEIENTFKKEKFCTSIGARFGFWIVSAEVFSDNPVIGVGASDAMKEVFHYINENHANKKCISYLPNLHNDFIQILVQLGALGGFIYLLIFYNISKLKIVNQEYQNLPIIFVSVYLISSMFENMIHQQFSMALFTMFVGIFLAYQKFENNKSLDKY